MRYEKPSDLHSIEAMKMFGREKKNNYESQLKFQTISRIKYNQSQKKRTKITDQNFLYRTIILQFFTSVFFLETLWIEMF